VRNLTATTLKHLKTKESRRKVPIHPVILQIGFMGYVEKCLANQKEPRLFSALKYDIHSARYSTGFSKTFSRLSHTHFVLRWKNQPAAHSYFTTRNLTKNQIIFSSSILQAEPV
jgi:hypothetical protein